MQDNLWRREDLDRNAHRLGLYADPVRVHGKTLNVAFVEPQRRVDSRPRLRAFVIVPPENVSQNPKTPKTYG